MFDSDATSEFNLESIDIFSGEDLLVSGSGGSGESLGVHYKEPGYEGEIDYRIRQLSFSSNTLLHKCPRKFQLYKLRTSAKLDEDPKSTITFAFGHCVGLGIQLVMEEVEWNTVLWRLFLQWHAPLFASDDKAAKSFFESVQAVAKFKAIRETAELKDYDLVYYNGKPATELSFCINFPDGFRYRGFVDAVLRHRITGEIIVLECKTTGNKTVDPAQFKNSAQAIGYSIVLDVLFPELSSYKVLYYVYQTHSRDFIPLPFTKNYLQRALWIKELLLDIESIKMYDAAGVYPMHGENCFDFYRPCAYINTCTLSTAFLTKPCLETDLDTTEYQVNINLLDLLQSQLEKT